MPVAPKLHIYTPNPSPGLTFNMSPKDVDISFKLRDGTEFNLEDVQAWATGDTSSLGLDRRMEVAVKELSKIILRLIQ